MSASNNSPFKSPLMVVLGILVVAIVVTLITFQQTPTVVSVTATSLPQAHTRSGAEADGGAPASGQPEAPIAAEDVEHDSEEAQTGPALDPEAIASMRQARTEGDNRAPPITRAPQAPGPSADELADPQLYEAFEARQEMAVYRRFTYAAEAKIQKLEKLVDRARAEGLPPEQLAEGEEKLARLKSMREELLLKYPDILDKDS